MISRNERPRDIVSFLIDTAASSILLTEHLITFILMIRKAIEQTLLESLYMKSVLCMLAKLVKQVLTYLEDLDICKVPIHVYQP